MHTNFATAVAVCLGFCAGASGTRIEVTITVDDAVLAIHDTTTLHVLAEVVEGGVADNGIYAYALNILLDDPALAVINSVQQLGNPSPSFSDPGTIQADGLHDVYGMDGDFFIDQNRGIDTPFEILALDIQALAEGGITFSSSLADIADAVGVADGFMVQDPGSVDVDFGPGVDITIIPEPTSLAWLALGCLAVTVSRRT